MSRTRRSGQGIVEWLFYLIFAAAAVGGMVAYAGFMSGCTKAGPPAPSPDRYQMARLEGALAELDDQIFILVSISTFRVPAPAPAASEEAFLISMRRAQRTIQEWVTQFNAGQKAFQLEPFEWRDTVEGKPKWVFGYRLGNGPRKIALIAHLDTVPPGEGWTMGRALDPYYDERELRGKQTRFIVGRGALDDKGPAVVGLQVMQALARRFDSEPKALRGMTFELVFDTSEETGMSVPHYFKAMGAPEVGVVMDGDWCIVAEKGIERSVFRVPLAEKRKGGFWIESLSTPRGAVNQIPDSATLRIQGRPKRALDVFTEIVETVYRAHFAGEHPGYTPAPITVSRDGQAVVITATVKGAQHGSAPELNLKSGWNPLVSLVSFAAYLVREGTLARNSLGQLAEFMASTWGTRVFGEFSYMLRLSSRDDGVFGAGNGTTYALTRFYTEADRAELHVDIRYALGHHSTRWDGKTAGTLAGPSTFQAVFGEIVEQFNKLNPGANVRFTTTTRVAPDLKDPSSPAFQSMFAAYQAVTGEECPRHAIGGGTDAKRFPQLMAMGPTFCQPGEDCLGPPRNYHGVNEGVPLEDLRQSARVYYRWAVDQALDGGH